MGNLRDIPIKRKLILILIATVAVVLLSAGFAIVAVDSYLFRDRLARDFSALTLIVANLNTAALKFDDPRAAHETLAALKARPHVVLACIYRQDGSELARYSQERYSNNSTPRDCPRAPAPDGIRFDADRLIVRRPVLLDGQRIGTVFLLSDLGELGERRQLYGSMVLAVLLLTSIAALLLTSRLRAAIVAPISHLAQTAARVAQTRNYSLRATKQSGDELGVLTDAFNEMLARVQAADSELRKAKEELEVRVADRTRDLEIELAERRRAEAALQRQTAELARSNADLQQFAYVASHDLQEPLRMVFSYMNLIAEQYAGKLDAEADEFIGYALDGARRMRQLITDLLEYSRLGSRNQELTPTDCSKIFREVRANLDSVIAETKAMVTAGELPVVLAEPSQITQLLQNLIVNGIKFHGPEPPRIHVAAEREGDCWKFSVADNGIGIEQEHFERIFVIFQRLHDRNAYAGTGIGLAICNKIVNRLGGRIWVESEPGSGACFYFTIPALARNSVENREPR